MNVTTIGLDIAKSVFHVVGADSEGRVVLRKRLKRAQVLEFFAQQAVCTVALEACGGAHDWGRRLLGLGHEVRLLNPREVKAFLRGSKNDYNDAAALCEAGRWSGLRAVPVKSEREQDLQALHRARAGVIKQRTEVVNQLRGLLAERGVVLGRGVATVRRRLPELLEEADNGLSARLRGVLGELLERLRGLEAVLAGYDRELEGVVREDAVCRRLLTVPGVGPVTATAVLARAGDVSRFRRGRDFAAWLGLVPRQHSSGGKPRLLGISKRGDRYLRTLLIHGGRSLLVGAARREDGLSRWAHGVRQRAGANRAAVALANKRARIVWAVLAHGQEYRARLAAPV